jgi:hypothetical protein
MSGTTANDSLNVTANKSTAARPLSSRFADFLNPADFGAKLDGVADDTAAFLACRNACPTDGVIRIPTGSHLNFWQIPTDNASRAGHGPVLWDLNGMNYGVSGGTVFNNFGNDMVETVFQGGKMMYRDRSTGSDTPLLRLNLNSTHSGGNASNQNALWATASVSGTPNSYVWPVLSQVSTSADGTGQHVAIAGAMTVNLKTDISALNLVSGGRGYTRATVTLSGGSGSGAAFNANISNGSIISFTRVSGGQGYAAGSMPTVTINGDGSGASAVAVLNPQLPNAPNFASNFATYDNTARNTAHGVSLVVCEMDICSDGADDFGNGLRVVLDICAFRQGNLPATPAGFGWGVRVNSQNRDPNIASFRRPFAATCVWSDAAFDASMGLSLNNAPAFRMGPNMTFDMTGDNQHTLRYDSTNGYLVFAANGKDNFSVTDGGTLTANQIKNRGAEVRNTRTVTSGDTAQAATDRVIIINKAVGARTTVTLQATPAKGTTLIVKDGRGDANINPITIAPTAPARIDNAGSATISIPSGWLEMIYDGANWFTI